MANQIRYSVGFDIQQANLNQLKSSLQQLQKMKISDIMKINDSDAATAKSALHNIQVQAANVEDALKAAFNTKLNTVNIETFNQSLKQSGTSIEQVYQAFKSAGTSGENAFRSLSSSVLSTNMQLKETHNLLDKMATTLANTIKWNAASSAVNTMSRSVEQAWGYVKSLDTSLNDIRIVTGKSADEMGKFAIQANNAAKELGKTTTDYTNAALIYAQQGLNDKEIAERAAITLKTANVTGQSTAAVSEELTAVWNGYKVNAEQAELYVDRLAAVAATTASDLEELSTGMSKVASAAAAMGVGQDQLAAQLSTIISVTREAPETIGTSLKTIYSRISDIKAGISEDGVTLGNYSGKMAELGFNVLNANGKLRDMGEVMEEIGSKWDTLTREQQIYLAQTMAGQRQYTRLLALFENFGQYNEALNTAQNAVGTLQEQQDIYMESTAAHLQVLKASVEDIYDSFADTDTINGLIDGLSTAATFTANLVDGLGGGGAVLRSLGAIGITVFSEQIARGLNTTITNLEIGKENARQFDQALQATKEWQGIPGLDKTSQDLLKNREQLLELARLMTPEQFSGMQTLLNDITQVGNEIAQLEDEQSFLNKAIEDVLKYSDAWQTAEEVMASDEGQAEVIKRLQQQEQGIQNVIKAINQYSKLQNVINTKMINGEAISSELEQAKQSVTNYYNELEKLGSSGQLSERHIQSLENIKKELDTLDDAVDEPAMAAKIQLIIGELKGIATTASQSATETRQKIESEMGAAADSIANKIAEKQAQLQSMVAQFVTGQERMQRAANIENYAKMAGGIAQVGSAIMQVQNLGSVWKNQDLTTGEKLLQTITNLAISLPMLATGFTKATTALGLMKTLTTEQAVLAGISTTAQAAHAVSIGLVETASGAAAIKVQLLNTTLMLNPFIAVATAAITLATAIGMITKAHDQAREAAIKHYQTEIDTENSKQQQISKNRELYSSIEDLNNQYENGQISRSEMKSAVEDLIEQYGLQGRAAEELTNNYNNLSDAIDKARAKTNQQAVDSASREKEAAENLLAETAKGKTFDNKTLSKNNDYNVTFAPGLDLTDEPQQIRKAFEDNGFTLIGNAYTTTIDYSPQSMQGLYDSVQKILDSADGLSVGEKLNSEWYQNLKDWADEIGPVLEQLSAAEQDLNNAQVNQVGDGLINSNDIKQTNDYLEKRSILIEEIQNKLNKTLDESTNLADAYLKNNFRDLYNQFDEIAKYIDTLKEKFGESNNLVESFIGKLSEEQLIALLDLPDSTLNNWDAVKDAIIAISNADLSNVDVINGNLDQAQASAADKFNIYQSLEDQVSGGKTVSKKQLQSLEPQVQEFFSMMANGTYKMTGDAKDFYETVDNLKLEGFHQVLDTIYDELNQLESLSGKNFDYDKLDQSAFAAPKMTDNGIDYDLVEDQLEYLNAVSGTNEELQIAVDLWKQQAENQEITKESADEIAQAIANVGDLTQDLNGKSEELRQKAEQVAHQLHDAMFPTDEDIDTEALELLSETLQDVADQSIELADSLTEDARTAEDVAQSILRFDDAIQDVVDNYDDWMAALDSGSLQEQAEVIDDLRDAYADLLDLDGTALSDDFLTNTDNLELMRAAIDGDIEAYNDLLELAGQDIAIQVGLDSSQFFADRDAVWDAAAELAGMDFGDIEIGAALNDEGFLAELSNMVNAAGMTAKQATDYLSSMGVDAEVIQTKTPTTEQKEQTGWTSNLVSHTEFGQVPIVSGMGMETMITTIPVPYTAVDSVYEPTTQTVTDTKENSAVSLKVTSAHKSSGGGFKFSQARNGGGSSGTARRSGGGGGRKSSPKKSSRKSSPKKSSTKKQKEEKPDTSTKDSKKLIEDERDIYHDINIELEQIDRHLERVQKKQDRLYGKQLLNNLNKQSKILEQHKDKLKEKTALQQKDLKNQREILKNLGVTFDKYGDISNYMSILWQKQTELNVRINEYNKLIQTYNASTDKTAKKALQDEIEAKNREVKAAEDDLKDIKDKIKNYDNLRKDMEDVVDQIEEEAQKQIEINIQKFRMEVEISLDMGKARRDWNEFRRKVLNGTDIIKDTNFSEVFKDAKKDLSDFYSYFTVKGAKGSLETLTDQLLETRNQIKSINKTGTSSIYGDNEAQAMEDLKKDLNELMEQMEDVKDLVDDIDKAYLDTIDDIEDQFDKQIEDYEYVGELIEHDIDLLQLLYGDRNYNAMNKYYTTLEKNNNKQLDSLRRQRNYWKSQWQEALNAGDTQAAKKFEENYKKTINNLNSAIEEAAKNLQDKYINAINKIFDELDRKISNGKGTDYLSTEWQLMNKNADEYLDTINSAFAIQETQRKYQKAIDETKNIKSQQSLKKLMNEQLDILKNKQKITQYDVDRAQKLLQVEQARIALQESQSAKTSMRLKRDSQGNYSYEYVADNGAVDDAAANLASAQNDLYNFDKDRYHSNLNDMISAWKDFQSEYEDIVSDLSLSEEDKVAKTALLREQYGEYINNKTAENLVVRTNLMDSAFTDIASIYKTDVDNYKNMSDDEKKILMEDLVPAWKSGIQQMSNKIAAEGGFIPTCEKAFKKIEKTTKDYQSSLKEMANSAGVNLEKVKKGVDSVATSLGKTIEQNSDLIKNMDKEMDSIEKIRNSVHNLKTEYDLVYTSAKQAVTQIYNFMQAQDKQAVKEASKYGAGDDESGSASKNKKKIIGAGMSMSNPAPSGGFSTINSVDGKITESNNISSTLIEGIAGNIWEFDTWGSGGTRKKNMIAKFGEDKGKILYDAVQAKFNSGYGYNGTLHEREYYRKYGISYFDSGGYTGTWMGKEGKIGILHQKELVLNANDTKNLLNTVDILHSIMGSLNGNLSSRLGSIKSGYTNTFGNNDSIEQNVHIEASFPNVDSKREIEEAFNDLVNLAAQRAMRR